MAKENREKSSDLHPDKESVNDGVQKIKHQKAVLNEPEARLQPQALDVLVR